MTTHFTMDLNGVGHELDRLADGPDLDDLLRLESVLTDVFQETQRIVHVRTGSLRGSGDLDSDYRDHTWHGDLSYGGQSPGFIHDPVRYAQIELARGGSHFFMLPALTADSRYLDAVLAFVRGDAA